MTTTASTDDAMKDEFDVHARWTQEAIDELGREFALPAACRGSASPAALRWLSAPLDAGALLLDVGGGMGGPAAFAAAEAGVRPVVVEPMRGACRAAAQLFGLPVMAAAGEALPVADGSVDAAWCLGVLCTTPRQAELLGELRRVLIAGAPLGLLVFVRRGDLTGGPKGNVFPTDDDLHRLLDGADLVVIDRAELTDMDRSPPDWQDATARVEQCVERRHGTDPRFAAARAQEQRIAGLLDDGRVAGVLLRARSRTPRL